MLPLAYFGIESNAFNLVMDLLILFAAVLYLSLIYWTYADARRRIVGPDADRLRDGGVAVPVRGHARVHDPAPAGVPRGRARARTGDAGGGGAPAPARSRPVPALRLSDRAGLHPLPELPAQVEGAVRELLQAARIGRGRSARTARRRSRMRPRAVVPADLRSVGAAPRRDSAAEGEELAVATYEDGRTAAGDPGAGVTVPELRAAQADLRSVVPVRARDAPKTSCRDPTAKEPMDRTLILVKPDAFARSLTRRDPRALRAQGAAHRGAAPDDDDARAGRAPLCRARARSRSSASSSTSSPRARSSRWCSRAPTAVGAARQVIGATNPLEAAPGLDPRRLRGRDGRELGARLGLAGVGGARGGACSSRG